MTDGERLSALEEVLSDLAELSRTHVLVVEGRKDCAALNNLGISGDMFMTQSGGGPVRAGEYVASRGGRSVVLTDWDDRGDRLAERLEEVLGKSPEDTDFMIRSKLRHLCRMYIKDIESLDTFVFGLRAKSI